MSTMQNTTANEPARKAKPEEYDLVILGGGTGGTIAAWTFAGQGQRVAVIERKYVGGSCPNIACLPSIPGYPHDEPGCFDPVFLQWMQDSLAGRTPHIDRIGISYMYSGAWAKSGKGGEEFHVGPHLMIVSPNQDDFQGFNRDPSNGMPYVTHLPNRTELYLVMPVREWNEQHVHE